jgi:hypothetical protein
VHREANVAVGGLNLVGEAKYSSNFIHVVSVKYHRLCVGSSNSVHHPESLAKEEDVIHDSLTHTSLGWIAEVLH